MTEFRKAIEDGGVFLLDEFDSIGSNIQLIELNDDLIQEIYNGINPFSEKGVEKFRGYLNKNEITYYGEPNTTFSMTSAYVKCCTEGNDKLIIENLS